MIDKDCSVPLNQDPNLRARVLPIFDFDPQKADQRPRGVGTTFRVDPWGNCATAFHAIEHLFEVRGDAVSVKPDRRIVALELEGIVYGSPPLPKNAWRPMAEFYADLGLQESPLLHQPKVIKNLSELARVRFTRSHQRTPMPFLPVNFRRSTPEVGQRVVALGFAGLDVDKDSKGDSRPIQQYLHEISGEVVEVIPADFASTRPWPKIRVNAHWPSGMSGGPVMDDSGQVIGIVSTSFSGADESMAACFAGWNLPERAFPTIDPVNPGSFNGFVRLDHHDDVVEFLEDDPKSANFFQASHNPVDGGWMTSSVRS